MLSRLHNQAADLRERNFVNNTTCEDVKNVYDDDNSNEMINK